MNIISLLKFMILLEWILCGITVAIMMLQLLMLKKSYISFFCVFYGNKSLEKIKENIVNVNNMIFKINKELLIISSIVIIALFSLFIIAISLNAKIELPPKIFLWMIGGFIIIPLFIVILDFYLRQTIFEIDKIKSKSIDRKENKSENKSI